MQSAREKAVNCRSTYFATNRVSDTKSLFDTWLSQNPNYYIVSSSMSQSVSPMGDVSNVLFVVYSIQDC